MLENKTVLIGVTGGIAAYKTAALVSRLHKAGADVHVLMTENARKFVGEATFDALSGNRTVTDTFDRNHEFNVEHVELAKRADVFMIAPATANVIAKTANGIADDMLTTTFLAARCPKYIAPAMNTNMYYNPVTQDNLAKLTKYGIHIIDPASGRLACGDTGAGKMPEPDVLFSYIEREIAREKDLLGKKVLVTAGATCESFDPVRFITNHSTGKMGFAVARECMLRGADVTVVKGSTTAEEAPFCHIVEVKSAEEMYHEVTARSRMQDIIIMAAAVSDYTPAAYTDEKVKKADGDMAIELKRTPDILKSLSENRQPGQFLCGFSMETENMLENSIKKLEKKNVDMIVANNLKEEGAGFGTDTNIVTLITKDGVRELDIMSKQDVAREILDTIHEKMKQSPENPA
ncbi:MAG: bifunctional phosphopantothenoylcysteine decarboxylase/phosphopantothenate--cysteine ligase CoaBC [Anaerovoracaceae bacterium]|jgi:phosphopantothenoylcysteine decarboxylase/phosphopantothenate--cysteine ligase